VDVEDGPVLDAVWESMAELSILWNLVYEETDGNASP